MWTLLVLNSQLKLVWSPGAAYIHGLTGNVMVPLSSLCCFLSCHFCLLACLLSLFINVCVPVFVSWQNSTYLLIMTHLFLILRQSPFIREWLDETQALVLIFLMCFFSNISVWKTYLYLMYLDSCGENPSMRLVSKVGLERGYLGRNIQGDSWVLGNWKGLRDEPSLHHFNCYILRKSTQESCFCQSEASGSIFILFFFMDIQTTAGLMWKKWLTKMEWQKQNCGAE